MKWGVPADALFGNIMFSAFFGMIMGGGNPLYYLLFFVIHLPLVILADRNPYFAHEWAVWFRTRAAIIGNTLDAHAPEGQSGV